MVLFDKEMKRAFSLFIILCLILTGIFMIYQKPTMTGYAVKDGEEELKITPECSYRPWIFKTWKVKNKNEFNVSYFWNLQNDTQNGTGVALPNNTYFNTTAMEGDNIVELYVNSTLIQTKLWNPDNCTVCAVNWSCENWTECENSTQIRSCIDLNDCSLNDSIPELIQNCSMPEPEPEVAVQETSKAGPR